MEWLRQNLPAVHGAITSVTQTVAKPVQNALPSVATDSGSAKMLGAPAESAGTTMTGGRRHRKQKTRKGVKRGGKTRRH